MPPEEEIARQLVRLAKRLIIGAQFPIGDIVRWLEKDDPDWFYGGCADVAEVIVAVAERLGHKAKVRYGTASTSEFGRVMHAWVIVDGKKFDPFNLVRGGGYSGHQVCSTLLDPDWDTVDDKVEDVIRALRLQ